MHRQRVPENARFAQGILRLELVPSAARMARLRNLCQGLQVQTPKPGYARVCKTNPETARREGADHARHARCVSGAVGGWAGRAVLAVAAGLRENRGSVWW